MLVKVEPETQPPNLGPSISSHAQSPKPTTAGGTLGVIYATLRHFGFRWRSGMRDRGSASESWNSSSRSRRHLGDGDLREFTMSSGD